MALLIPTQQDITTYQDPLEPPQLLNRRSLNVSLDHAWHYIGPVFQQYFCTEQGHEPGRGALAVDLQPALRLYVCHAGPVPVFHKRRQIPA